MVRAARAANGYLYVLDTVLLTPEDSQHLVQVQLAPSTAPSSNRFFSFDYVLARINDQQLDPAAAGALLCGMLALMAVALVALVLVRVRARRAKLNRHEQLESGLASSSSSSAHSTGSTSTTKSL